MSLKEKVFDEVLKEIRYKYRHDPRVIEYVIRHLCRFVNANIKDPTEERPIRLKYFGAFALKKNAVKQ